MGPNHFQMLGNILCFPEKYLFARFGFLNIWELSFEVAVTKQLIERFSKKTYLDQN
jgi:hypothetical protein